jgi:hypothetical protein
VIVDELTIDAKGLPVLRLVNAQYHDRLIQKLTEHSYSSASAKRVLADFQQSEADLKKFLVGKQLRIYP